MSNSEKSLYIYGRNAVSETLKSGRSIEKMFVDKPPYQGSLQMIVAKAKEMRIPIQVCDREKLNELAQGGHHQGVVVQCAATEYVDVEDILKKAEEKGEAPFLLLLDGIEDPHNLGAIIRTAHQAGAHGVIIPKNRAAGLTATVARVSAGALAYLPVAQVTNLARTMEELKKEGLWFACADMDGDVLYRQDLKGPLGLVIGSEGSGVSQNVKKHCDFVVSIPMAGQIDSLNASVAAGILMYEVVRQRNYA